MRQRLNMLCPIAFGNWNNASNAGPGARNFNNTRGNSNDNVGFASDPLPVPHIAHAIRQRGRRFRALRRNGYAGRVLVGARSPNVRAPEACR